MKHFKIVALILFLVIITNCDKNNPTSSNSNIELTSEHREKFIGSWAGTYECTNLPGDTLIINKGSGELDFSIALHAYTGVDPELVTGKLTKLNEITIHEQTIGGFEGSGEITYFNNKLTLVQRGLGLICRGSGYKKF